MAHTSTTVRGGGPSSAPSRRRRASRGSGLPPRLIPYVLLGPGLLVIAVLLLYPLYQVAEMSFYDMKLKNVRPNNPVPPEFVGLDNYTKVFDSDLFWPSLRNTIFFALAAVVLTIGVGTLVGLLLNRLGRKMSLFVIVGVMAAWATPPVAQGIIWRWLFDADAGAANWVLNLLPDWLSNLVFGKSDWSGHPWFNDAFSIFLVLTLAVVWASFPFISVSILAGLKSIPSELYEAAKMDGSGVVSTFRKITLPMLRPVYSVLIVLSIIWDFRVFTQLYMLAGGTVNRDAYNLSLWMYAEAFGGTMKMGLGAAIAVVLTGMLLIITFVYVRQIVKTEDVR
ncbi:carbohydrate ABC transporter permease [Sphaerimonospora cavernae]|uniref:Carbohydrate ABC transporter permease n=1 Tax=Sphaerimonospora cavernae TaxID=1740611 RepID=A0ABV6TYT7_9ACTN